MSLLEAQHRWFMWKYNLTSEVEPKFWFQQLAKGKEGPYIFGGGMCRANYGAREPRGHRAGRSNSQILTLLPFFLLERRDLCQYEML